MSEAVTGEHLNLQDDGAAQRFNDASPASFSEINAGDALARQAPNDAISTLKVWASKIVDGGLLSLIVPDFDAVVESYAGGDGRAEALATGDGAYRSIWNRDKISRTLNLSGFEILGSADGTSWRNEKGFLSLVARKITRPTPKLPMADVHAVMSMPRVCWTDTMGAVHLVCSKLGINFTKATGVFWGQCLQRVMESVTAQENGPKYILTIDYDSIFNEQDVIRLWQIMETNEDIAALCPLQIGRDRETVLLTLTDEQGNLRRTADPSEFHVDALDIGTGHFGLTMIRTSALRTMPKPWFLGVPNAVGEWGEGRIDDDIYFWKSLKANGGRIAVCPKVRIGHLQLVITWPNESLQSIHQYVSKYNDDGRPDECMTF